jgi:EAL domain-containing protein (putative c-di-GMP-specific phosphodiesterase class I)
MEGARYEVADSPSLKGGQRWHNREELQRALEERAFQIAFQPQIDLRNGNVVGLEAFVQWQHLQRGLLPPAEVLSLAEQADLLVPIERSILREACRHAGNWRAQFQHTVRFFVSLGLSAGHLLDARLLDIVRDALRSASLSPDHLELEVPERAFAENPGFALRACQQLRDIGVRVALKEFGIGGAPLASLRQFPVDFLKLDRLFINLLLHGPSDDRLVEAMINLGQALHLPVVATDIESFEQVMWLRDHRCSYGQGPYFSPLLEASAVPDLLSSNRPWLRSLYRPPSQG